MKKCIYCKHANLLCYNTNEISPYYRFIPHYIYCDYLNKPKQIQDECKNWEEIQH